MTRGSCSSCCWTVEARPPDGDWSVWSSYVDRVTAEGERAFAEGQGFVARVGAFPRSGGTDVRRYELPLPCNHAPSRWAYRICSHTDEETDTREKMRDLDRAFSSVWVCARPECIERGKRYVASSALCTPVVIDGKRAKAATS